MFNHNGILEGREATNLGRQRRPLSTDPTPSSAEASALFRDLEPHLRPALLAYGVAPDVADDAIGDTFLYLCANENRVLRMENPRGYLYKVARDRARGPRRKKALLPPPAPPTQPEISPELLPALARLSRNQRTAVFLITGLGWTWSEVADFLGTTVSTARNHHRRGLEKLRRDMGAAS